MSTLKYGMGIFDGPPEYGDYEPLHVMKDRPLNPPDEDEPPDTIYCVRCDIEVPYDESEQSHQGLVCSLCFETFGYWGLK